MNHTPLRLRPLAPLIFALLATALHAAPIPFTVTDSCAPPKAQTPAQQAGLDTLRWTPAQFEAKRKPAKAAPGKTYDEVITFPSALPSGQAKLDRVILHWHHAADAKGQPLKDPAPCVLVLSPLAPDMLAVGDRMAQSLALRGVNAFAIALPGDGARADENQSEPLVGVAIHSVQAVADVRRAADVIRALPGTAPGLGLEALCLGGLAAVPAQGLDNTFDAVVLGFTGGDLPVFFHSTLGMVYAMAFDQAGISGEKFNALIARVEPTRMAGRIQTGRVHLFTFDNDSLWPAACDAALVKAMDLPKERHTVLNGTHFSMFANLDKVEAQLLKMMRKKAPTKP